MRYVFGCRQAICRTICIAWSEEGNFAVFPVFTNFRLGRSAAEYLNNIGKRFFSGLSKSFLEQPVNSIS